MSAKDTRLREVTLRNRHNTELYGICKGEPL